MSTNPEFERVVALEPDHNGRESVPPETPAWAGAPAATAETALTGAVPFDAPAYALPALVPAPAQKRSRGWIGTVAVAVVGLIASGTLGYLLYTTTGQRDVASHQLALTKEQLATTQQTLDKANADLTGQKAVAQYMTIVVNGEGRAQTDYHVLAACKTYGACLTAGQALLTDLRAFQAARTGAVVPSGLQSGDGMLGDALSAAISGAQVFVNGMVTFNVPQVTSGLHKVDAAMLSVGKAESAIAAGIH
jgi:hypothetical protein